MLEVLHLSKIYKTKGGADVKALDDVSLRFPEKGMVFLLGKSGSGKSTLLNVCGGLDAPTDGEIIVKGRSSKSFSQSDFDSYRNTFIGFIFQEYNILNEFSVEENIALALELQGKPRDKAAVAKLLEEVDLTGYAKRKPNTLSGGQKQRIAIARALIKAPEIIMADEPTGALDSATGKQVFDTLKKLSKDKLVIVVSHDRDFAEQYGDRVIELKDGKIISDVSKTQEAQKTLTDNISIVGDTLCIKQGSALDEKDFAEIKSFLRNADKDVVIAGGEKDIKAFKEVSRITDDGSQEVFRDTNEASLPQKAYSPEESRFIRSKLPLRHAAKIGVSGLKTKPVRLFFTIVLCTIAFILFGLLSTMTFYDGEATFKQTLTDSSYNTVRVGKQYQTHETRYEHGEATDRYTSWSETRFSAAEINAYASTFGSDSFGAIRAGLRFNVQNNSNYWINQFSYFAYLPENNSLRSKMISGSTYPTADDEILISSYTANVILNCKLFDANGNALEITQISELIGKSFSLNGSVYKITGIFECDELPAQYDSLKDTTSDDDRLKYELESELSDGLYQVAFLTEDALTEYARRYNYSGSTDMLFNNHDLTIATTQKDGEYVFEDNAWSNGAYAAFSQMTDSSFHFFKAGQTAPGAGETVISASLFYERMNQLISRERSNLNDSTAPYDSHLYRSSLFSVDLSHLVSEWENAIDNNDTNYGFPDANDSYYFVYEEWRSAYITSDSYDADYYRGQLGSVDLSYLVSEWENAINNSDSDYSFPDENDPCYSVYTEWKNAYSSYIAKQKQLDELDQWQNMIYMLQQNGSYGKGDGKDDSNVLIALTSDEREALINELLTFLQGKELSPVKARLYSQSGNMAFGDVMEFKIVGVYGLMPFNDNSYNNRLLLTDSETAAMWNTQKTGADYYYESYTNYKPTADAVYDTVFLPYDHSQASTEKLVEIYNKQQGFDENDTRIRIESSLISNFEMVDSMIDQFSKIFLYVGLVIAVFAALLFSNFISVSISNKKREIGILRAVGARSFDVFKIFFSESFVIAMICVALSLGGSLVLCKVLNAQVNTLIGASLFVFGILSVVVLVGVALLTAVISTFLPVYNAAKKKPVESIRSL